MAKISFNQRYATVRSVWKISEAKWCIGILFVKRCNQARVNIVTIYICAAVYIFVDLN